MICGLGSIYLNNLQLGIQQRQTASNFRLFWYFIKWSENGFTTTLSVWFFKKNIFHVMFYVNWPNLITWFLYFLRYWSTCVLQFGVCNVINFEISIIFQIKPFFSTRAKSQDKNLNILRMRRACKMKWKSVFDHF